MLNYIKSKINYEINLGGHFDKLTKKACNEIIKNIEEEYHDFPIKIRNCMAVIEISTIENEKDIHIYSMKEYFDKYGTSHLEDWYEEGEINKDLYKAIKSQL